jgi:hypothetical protein
MQMNEAANQDFSFVFLEVYIKKTAHVFTVAAKHNYKMLARHTVEP